MIEWVLRQLPGGGTGYHRPTWDTAARDELVDRFMASKFAKVRRLGAAAVRELVGPLAWFGCDRGPGDPLRWSPVAIEIVLTDWYPHKVVGLSQEIARRLPDVLTQFVRFADDQREMPAELTAETLSAVAALTDAYHGLIDDAPDNGDELDDELEALALDAMASGEMTAIVTFLEREAVAAAGGREAWEQLDDAPLADRPFDWSVVPDDLREQTAETLAALDAWSADLFDTEVRAIARAVLAPVVANDPAMFKRTPRTDVIAAAILSFLLARLTGRMSQDERRSLGWAVTTVKQLVAATGVPTSTLNARTRTVAGLAEYDAIDWPSVLHSSQRRELVRSRELISAWRDDHAT